MVSQPHDRALSFFRGAVVDDGRALRPPLPRPTRPSVVYIGCIRCGAQFPTPQPQHADHMKIEIYESRSFSPGSFSTIPTKLGSITMKDGLWAPSKGDSIEWGGQKYKIKRRYIMFNESEQKGTLTVQLYVKKQ